ncbi:MAG: PEP-CTERM sorting domain-containing protein, partial [Isosphaerales bacterium]
LIVNGGFETGDFSGWTATPASQGSGFYVASEAGIPSRPNQGPTPFYIPHSGTYVAVMGAFDVGFFDSISQTVATTPGQPYVIDFWLFNGTVVSATPSSEFKASWGGNVLLDQANPPVLLYPSPSYPAYTEYTFVETPTTASTTLQFSAYETTGYFLLDDVSVSAVPEPSTLTLLGIGAFCFWGFAWRRRKQAA